MCEGVGCTNHQILKCELILTKKRDYKVLEPLALEILEDGNDVALPNALGHGQMQEKVPAHESTIHPSIQHSNLILHKFIVGSS
jgi:hypothetical protein